MKKLHVILLIAIIVVLGAFAYVYFYTPTVVHARILKEAYKKVEEQNSPNSDAL